MSPNVWQLTSTYAATNPLTPLDDTVTAVSTPIPGSGGTTISSIVSFTLYQPWVYVTDTSSGTPIDVFDERGNPITTTATQPWYDIPSPTGITYDPHNQQLYIAGEGGNIVYVNDVEGNDIYPSGTPWRSLGSPMSALYVPSNNFIYVGNAGSWQRPCGYHRLRRERRSTGTVRRVFLAVTGFCEWSRVRSYERIYLRRRVRRLYRCPPSSPTT